MQHVWRVTQIRNSMGLTHLPQISLYLLLIYIISYYWFFFLRKNLFFKICEGFFALYMYFSKDLGTGNLPIGNQLTDELLVTVYQIRWKSSFIFSNVLWIFRLAENSTWWSAWRSNWFQQLVKKPLQYFPINSFFKKNFFNRATTRCISYMSN